MRYGYSSIRVKRGGRDVRLRTALFCAYAFILNVQYEPSSFWTEQNFMPVFLLVFSLRLYAEYCQVLGEAPVTRRKPCDTCRMKTSSSTTTLPYKGHRFPQEIISHAVWLYYRFSLSYRDVEELLAERGIGVTYETVRSGVSSSANSTPISFVDDAPELETSGTWMKYF